MGRYPADWDSRRRTVYQRDGYTCQRCDAGGGPNGNHELHAHHIVPISEGGSHTLDNLITLCQHCHSKIHGDIFAPQWVGGEDLDGTMPEPSQVPSEIQPYFAYIHAYNGVAEVYEDVIDLLNELEEMLEAAITLQENDGSLSSELHTTYPSLQKDLLIRIDTLERQLEHFLACDKYQFSSEFRRTCTKFERHLSESVKLCVKYSDHRKQVVTNTSQRVEVLNLSESDEYDRMVELRQEHENQLEQTMDVFDELESGTVDEINQKLAKHPGVSVRTERKDEEAGTPHSNSSEIGSNNDSTQSHTTRETGDTQSLDSWSSPNPDNSPASEEYTSTPSEPDFSAPEFFKNFAVGCSVILIFVAMLLTAVGIEGFAFWGILIILILVFITMAIAMAAEEEYPS